MRWLAVAVLAACGRVGFPAHGDSAGPGDAPLDGVAGCPPTALLCDGFESGDLSKWSGNYIEPGATLTVQTTTVHGGRYALDGNIPAVRAGAAAEAHFAFSSLSTGMLAVREWVFAPQPLIDFDGVIRLDGANIDQYTLLNADGTGAWTATEDSSSAGIHDHISTTQAVENAWVCVELDYALDPPRGVAIYIADALVLMDTTYDPAPAYGVVAAGMTRADAAGAHVIVDDVVIARAHVGCH